MDENRDETGRAFFWGTIIGALVGAAVAIWKAPRSGKATRDMLEGQGRKLIGETETAQSAIEAGKAEARRLNKSK